jgi:iron complex transport system ATP-binding protein
MLQMINVSAGYGKKNVLNSIDLEINPGDFFVVIGLNGSGKSTLLKTMLGLLPLTSGKILIDKKNLRDYSFAERAKLITLLDTQVKTTFSMTVFELLEIARQRSNGNVNEVLETVGLQGYENKNILELSSGESKRAFLAHTLISQSKIILLDEPFAHLDWSHQEELTKNLQTWSKKYGSTFVLAVHELERAVQVANKICVMNNGSILKIDSPEAIFQSREVSEIFAFKAVIDKNPLDGSKRLTLGKL